MGCEKDDVCGDAGDIYLYKTNIYAYGYPKKKKIMFILFDLEHLHQTIQNRKIYQFYIFKFQNHLHQSN